MIALGSDQAGYELKQEIIKYLEENGYEYKDYGSYSTDPVDYPVYGKKVAHAIADGECDKGILICGTGIGISIAANKVKGIRAAVLRRLFQCRGDETSQRCQYRGTGRTGNRPGTCRTYRRHIPAY